jgi:hypothetical protein
MMNYFSKEFGLFDLFDEVILYFSRKIKFIFDGRLVPMTYNNLAYKGQSDFYRRPFLQTFGFGVYYTVSQLMSRLGALRESDFDLHVQQYETKEKFNLLSVRLKKKLKLEN